VLPVSAAGGVSGQLVAVETETHARQRTIGKTKMINQPIWYEVPAIHLSGAERAGEDDPYGFVGSYFLTHSSTHKYFHLENLNDTERIERIQGAIKVTGEFVTKACELLVPANRLLVSEKLIGDENSPSSINLGDKLSSLLRALGFRKSCSGCNERRNWLNSLFTKK
jgi:hypothetical protein